jgi:two-component system LytT family sensor kinase
MEQFGSRQHRIQNLGLVFAAWTLAGLLLATQAWVARSVRGDPIALGQTLSIWLTWAYLWALLTPLPLWLLAKWPLQGPAAGPRLLIHLCASVAIALLDLAAYAVAAPYIGALSAGADWWSTFERLFGTNLLLNIPVYWLIIGVAHVLAMREANREREHRALMLSAQLGEARLEALRAQLQPHFLFNALNTIAVLMHENVPEAHLTLLRLSQLLRRAIDSQSPMLPLREELELLDAYLAIEVTRFGDRLTVGFDVDPKLLDEQIPCLLLQPLVENAVRHGLGERGHLGKIELRVMRDGDRMCITLQDNGRGIAADRAEGVGLSNTRARLELLYPGKHLFDIGPADGGGTLVKLMLPLTQPDHGLQR